MLFVCITDTGKQWNFLLKHSTNNLQEISNEIYCKTVVILYPGSFARLDHFLASLEISNFMYFF